VAQGPEEASEPAGVARLRPPPEAFRELFREGMGLVEEAAAYLDGAGREEARGLSRAGSLAYAAESMRLTTRLMQMASWLLLQRAVEEGEITAEQAGREKAKVRLDEPDSPERHRRELPPGLLGLIDRSVRLQDRIRHLDAAMYGSAAAAGGLSPIAEQIDRLESALSGRLRRR